MSIDELYEKHPDKWVLAKVLKEDRLGKATDVEIVMVSDDRDEVYEAIGAIPDGEHVATLFTGEVLEEGEAFAFEEK